MGHEIRDEPIGVGRHGRRHQRRFLPTAGRQGRQRIGIGQALERLPEARAHLIGAPGLRHPRGIGLAREPPGGEILLHELMDIQDLFGTEVLIQHTQRRTRFQEILGTRVVEERDGLVIGDPHLPRFGRRAPGLHLKREPAEPG